MGLCGFGSDAYWSQFTGLKERLESQVVRLAERLRRPGVAGPILEIGNTNSRFCFPLGARGFVQSWNAQGPAHHCAVGVGHVAGTLKKAAALMELGFFQVC